MKKSWSVGMLITEFLLNDGRKVNATDPEQGILGSMPIFRTKRQAMKFVGKSGRPVFAVLVGETESP